MMNQWADIGGGKGAQGVDINGVVPGITYFPLSHDVGKSCIKTEAQKREKLPFGTHAVSPGSSSNLKHYRDTHLKTCMRRTLHCSLTLYSTLSSSISVSGLLCSLSG